MVRLRWMASECLRARAAFSSAGVVGRALGGLQKLSARPLAAVMSSVRPTLYPMPIHTHILRARRGIIPCVARPHRLIRQSRWCRMRHAVPPSACAPYGLLCNSTEPYGTPLSGRNHCRSGDDSMLDGAKRPGSRPCALLRLEAEALEGGEADGGPGRRGAVVERPRRAGHLVDHHRAHRIREGRDPVRPDPPAPGQWGPPPSVGMPRPHGRMPAPGLSSCPQLCWACPHKGHGTGGVAKLTGLKGAAHQGGMDCLTMVNPDVTISTSNMTPPAHQPPDRVTFWVARGRRPASGACAAKCFTMQAAEGGAGLRARTAGGRDVQIGQRAGQQPVQRGVDQHGAEADQVEYEELAHAPVKPYGKRAGAAAVTSTCCLPCSCLPVRAHACWSPGSEQTPLPFTGVHDSMLPGMHATKQQDDGLDGLQGEGRAGRHAPTQK